MLIHNQGIFLDEKVYDLVKNISEDYARRGGRLCILGFTTSVFFVVFQRRMNYCTTNKTGMNNVCFEGKKLYISIDKIYLFLKEDYYV